MKKVNSKKGFTLAELLIVVAVIAVLVAIAIPTFTTQLEKSREARDLSELRAAYASVMAASLEAPKTDASITVNLSQTQNEWQSSEVIIAGTDISSVTPSASGTMTVKYSYNSGSPKIEISNGSASQEIVDKFAADGQSNTPQPETVYETVTPGNTDNPSELGYYVSDGSGGYAVTTDDSPQTGTTYYQQVTYTPVSDPTGNPSESSYYEKNGSTFTLSTDTEVSSGKTYYTQG